MRRIQKRPISKLPNAVFEQLGWDYFISEDAKDYLTTELAVIDSDESEDFYAAASHLYERFVEVGERMIKENKLGLLGIPQNLHDIIRDSWEKDHLHLFGRFDFAGGVAGLPIKLIEFNADTPTALPETAIIQWAQLQANGIDENQQFNFVLDALIEQFRRLKTMHPDRDATILFSTMRDAPEDDNNISLLTEAAREAGLSVDFRYIDEVVFSDTEGIFAEDESGKHHKFSFWFKLVPWEYIAQYEPDLCRILTKIVREETAIVLNPAYTMIFQSKAILKFLWEYFPMDTYLLETAFDEPIRTNYAYVKKVLFGREGSNVTIHDKIGLPIEVSGGEYANQPSIFQELAELGRDEQGQYYQAGVFYAYEPCGLGFRRSPNLIIDNGAQFVGHTVVD